MDGAINFFVPGIPKPQPRPRAVVRGKHAGVYDPGTASAWRADVRAAALSAAPREPFTGGVVVSLAFAFQRPASHLKKRGGLTRNAPAFPTGRNDVDNLAKAVIDAMDGLGFWGDDGQIVDLRVTKAYGRNPGVEIVMHAAEAVVRQTLETGV